MNINCLTGETDEHIHWFSKNIGIHHDVVEPWQQLCLAAKAQGFDLTITSGFRSFKRQLSIWNRKFSGELNMKDLENKVIDIHLLKESELISAILTFSALPSTSRHHWGTDIDFYDKNQLNNNQVLQLEPWEYQENGPFAKLTKWLLKNAKDYGFYFPYDSYRGGVAEEPWHLSYFPLAEQFEKSLTSSILKTFLSDTKLAGKKLLLSQLEEILKQYVFNIGQNKIGENKNG